MQKVKAKLFGEGFLFAWECLGWIAFSEFRGQIAVELTLIDGQQMARLELSMSRQLFRLIKSNLVL